MTTTEYLLDTNACIAIRQLLANKLPKNQDRLRAIAALRQRWQQAHAHTLAMSLITLGELEFGASKSQATDARDRLAALRAAVAVLIPDATVASHYGAIRHHLEKTGQGICYNDTWIAAHGLATGRTVVTHNASEFGRVPGLNTEDWAA